MFVIYNWIKVLYLFHFIWLATLCVCIYQLWHLILEWCLWLHLVDLKSKSNLHIMNRIIMALDEENVLSFINTETSLPSGDPDLSA